MLQNLHVKNLALITETEVEFKEGLNILTGETGAGKSIIIGSVALALGEKVPKELLRDNEETALVELVFSVENPKVLDAIRQLGIETEDETVILSRKITSGRAIARINGEAVSASRLKEVASLLIDIHGQHEHQSLLSKKKHLEILDAYAKDALGEKKERLAACYQEYRTQQTFVFLFFPEVFRQRAIDTDLCIAGHFSDLVVFPIIDNSLQLSRCSPDTFFDTEHLCFVQPAV